MSLIRSLRKAKKLSQRELAKKLGIARSQLQRLEAKPFEKMTIAKVNLLSQCLGLTLDEIFEYAGYSELKEKLTRSTLKNPLLSLSLGEGVELHSFVKDFSSCFIGSLQLSPQKTLSREKLIHNEFFFALVLEGNLHITTLSGHHVIKESECFTFKGKPSFELYNPHQFRNLYALIVSLP